MQPRMRAVGYIAPLRCGAITFLPLKSIVLGSKKLLDFFVYYFVFQNISSNHTRLHHLSAFKLIGYQICAKMSISQSKMIVSKTHVSASVHWIQNNQINRL